MNKLSSLLNNVNDKVFGIDRKFNSAIIVAAGNGKRAETGNTTKQMIHLLGIPVVARTVSVFENCGFIDEIIIVGKKDELPLYNKYISDYGWMKVTKIVEGGETRFDSVLNGFKVISDKSQFVYIHDGARCLVTEEMIRNTGHAALKNGSAYAASKSTDTVRVIDGDSVRTPDRNNVWFAQTPQVFLTEMYRASAYLALKNDITVTDDVMLAEAAGFKPVPVDCGHENIKITHPCDFSIAEAIIKYRNS